MYDYIIIGAGLGGLSAGLELANNKQKVLILEKNSLPGGLCSTKKQGRFEFDRSIYDLYDYGNPEKRGKIRKILDEYEINLETIETPINSRIKVIDSNEDYEIIGDIDEFFLKLEEIKKGSMESLTLFLKVIKEIHEALEELKDGSEELNNYPYFKKYLNANVIEACKDLKLSETTIHHLGYFWIYLNSPLEKLSFIDFADFMYKIVFKGIHVLKNKNIDLALTMVRKYQDLDGKIFYHSPVTEITDENDLKVVKTSDGKTYKARNIISDVSKHYVYQDLIKDGDKRIKQLENARTLSSNGVVVYLGLNKDYATIGLNRHHYYLFQNIDSKKNIKSMSSLKHHTMEGIVPNVVNSYASPKNTTILVLKMLYFGNPFEKVTKDNYLDLKEDIAKYMIEEFETNFGIDISEYIEEMMIATPIDFKCMVNTPNGSMYGYMRKSYDNMIHRVISYQDEEIPNISFVGASSLFGAGADNAIESGYYIANKLMERNKM